MRIFLGFLLKQKKLREKKNGMLNIRREKEIR